MFLCDITLYVNLMVVMFAKHANHSLEKNGVEEVRKSERKCKGKRYEMFMLEAKLWKRKRNTKLIQQKQCTTEIKTETASDPIENKTEPRQLDLTNTIKRLAERINTKLDKENQNNNDAENQRACSISRK